MSATGFSEDRIAGDRTLPNAFFDPGEQTGGCGRMDNSEHDSLICCFQHDLVADF
jgi:hypothetical protein